MSELFFPKMFGSEINEPAQDKTYNKAFVTSKDSD